MMSSNNDSTRTRHSGGLLIIGVALIIGLVANFINTNRVTEALQAEVVSLGTALERMSNVQQSPESFQHAVVDALESIAAKKQRELVAAKYAKYELAESSVPEDKSIYGSLAARFTLVEFSEVECPFCKRFHQTAKQIVDASKGNVNWQWKHFPLDFHNPAANTQALAAECVREQRGNRGFWVFLDDVFKQSRGGGQGVPNLAEIVTGVGADLTMVEQCLDEERYDQKLAQDIRQAKTYGISSTPVTIIVDNSTGRSQMITGAQPAEAVMAVIRKMVAEVDEAALDGASR